MIEIDKAEQGDIIRREKQDLDHDEGTYLEFQDWLEMNFTELAEEWAKLSSEFEEFAWDRFRRS